MADSLRFDVAGKSVAMYAQEVPLQAVEPGRPAIVLLHGSGGHIDFWVGKLAGLLAEARIGFYAPHYFESTGTVRADLASMTDGYHVPRWLETADAALRFVATRPTVDPRRIVLAGISLGAFLGLALAARLSAAPEAVEQQRIRALVDVSGGLVAPYDALATVHMPPTLILHGEADNIVAVHFAQQLAERLKTLRVPFRQEILPGEGHWFSSAALPRILLVLSEFLQQQIAM